MPTDEFGPVAERAQLPAAHVDEGRTRMKVGIPGIAGEQGTAGGVDLRDDEWRHLGALVAEDPVDVISQRQLPQVLRLVRDADP